MVQSGKLVRTLGKDSHYVKSLSVSRDGELVVSGHMADGLKLWDAKSGRRELKQPYSSNDQVAFSPNGKHVVSGGENGNVMVWDVQTGNFVWSVMPVDCEAEKRAAEEALNQARVAAILTAERKLKIGGHACRPGRCFLAAGVSEIRSARSQSPDW